MRYPYCHKLCISQGWWAVRPALFVNLLSAVSVWVITDCCIALVPRAVLLVPLGLCCSECWMLCYHRTSHHGGALRITRVVGHCHSERVRVCVCVCACAHEYTVCAQQGPLTLFLSAAEFTKRAFVLWLWQLIHCTCLYWWLALLAMHIKWAFWVYTDGRIFNC